MTDPWGVPTEPRQESGQPFGQQQPGSSAEQNPYGQQQTPYLERDPYSGLSDAGPVQQGSGQFGQYGAQEPFGQPGPYPAGPAVKQSNGLALAGAIVSFVPVVGLILSIIGRARAKALGGAGKTAGTVGIVLSILFTGGAGFSLYEIGKSTAADPACISAESDVARLTSTLTADESALSSAEQSGDKTSFTTAGTKFVSDIQSLKSKLDGDEAKATHSNVRSAIQNFDGDLGTFATGMQQVLGGDTSNESATDQAVNRLETDGNAIDNLCGNVGNG